MLKTEEPKSRLTFMARITNLGRTILHVTKDEEYAKQFV